MISRGVGIAAWVALLVCAIVLSILAAQRDTFPADERIMSWAQDRAFPGQTLSDAVRAITATQVVIASGVVAALLLWSVGYRWEAAALAVGLVLLPLMQAGIKELVDRPRPMAPQVDLRADFSSESFPAGHVMSPTFLYGFLLYLFVTRLFPSALRRLGGAVCVAIIVAAGPPNVWLGVHWPSDVMGGAAWGLALAGGVALALEAVRVRYA